MNLLANLISLIAALATVITSCAAVGLVVIIGVHTFFMYKAAR